MDKTRVSIEDFLQIAGVKISMTQRIFPAIKNMRNGILPDFNQMGEMVYPEDASADEAKSAFARYMEDATFLIPTPQTLLPFTS